MTSNRYRNRTLEISTAPTKVEVAGTSLFIGGYDWESYEESIWFESYRGVVGPDLKTISFVGPKNSTDGGT